MDYDFAVGANGNRQVDAGGTFFKYVSGTGLIQVRTSAGDSVQLLPGQGMRNVKPFNYFAVTDKTGAPNAGVINAGIGEFIDDRVSGAVAISGIVTNADNVLARALAGQLFTSNQQAAAPGAGVFNQYQLWNPANSGVNAFLKKLEIETATVGSALAYHSNAIVGAGATPGLSRKFPTALSKSLQNVGTAAAPSTGVLGSIRSYPIAAARNFIDLSTMPFCLTPGTGLVLGHSVANSSLIVVPEFEEVPV